MSTPVTSPRTPPPVKLDRVSGGVYPRSPNVSVNKNVEWINSKGAWTFYLALILLNWLLLSTVMSPGEHRVVCSDCLVDRFCFSRFQSFVIVSQAAVNVS